MTKIRIAEKQDVESIKAFIEQADVSVEGIENIIDSFVLLEDESKGLLGTLGVERIERDGLLRSLVISPGFDQANFLTLFKSAISLAKEKEVENLYLATNKEASIPFFGMLGFHKAETADIPTHMIESGHIAQLLETTDPILMVSRLN